MQIVKAIIATTHVDRHGDKLAPSALDDMVRQVEANYVPVRWNHDIRFPPLGRSIEATVVPTKDGELALETTSEYWEAGDAVVDLKGDGRVVKTHHIDEPGFTIRYDRGFSRDGDLAAAAEIAAIAGPDRLPQEVGKKALEPDAVLVVAVGTIVGSIALGFLQHLGEDVYEQLKQRVARYVAERDRPLLVDFDITFERDGRRTVHVLLDGPGSSDVEAVFDRRFDGLDVMVDECLARVVDMDHVVATWVEGALLLNYAVRRDGVPVLMGRAIPKDLTRPSQKD